MNKKTTIVMILCLLLGIQLWTQASEFSNSSQLVCDTSKVQVYNFQKAKLEDGIQNSLNKKPSVLIACERSNVLLNAPISSPNAMYRWIGPNGFSAYSSEIFIAQISTAQSGDYYIEVIENEKITKGLISIFVKEIPELSLAQYIFSSKNNLILSTQSIGKEVKYTWLTNDNEPLASTREIKLSPHPVGLYTYKLAVEKNGCISTDTFQIIVD